MKLWISSQGAKTRSGYLMMAKVWLTAGSNPDSQGCSHLISVFPHPSSALLWSVSLTLAQPVSAPCSDSFVCILTVCCFANLFLLVSSYEHLSLLSGPAQLLMPSKMFCKDSISPPSPFSSSQTLQIDHLYKQITHKSALFNQVKCRCLPCSASGCTHA